MEQKAFDKIKRVMAKGTLLFYPDFNKLFEIHTDASLCQIGAAITQDGKHVVFYSRKLNKAQLNYTISKKELLSVVEKACSLRISGVIES